MNHYHNTKLCESSDIVQNTPFFYLKLYLIPGNTVICNRISSIKSRTYYL